MVSVTRLGGSTCASLLIEFNRTRLPQPLVCWLERDKKCVLCDTTQSLQWDSSQTVSALNHQTNEISLSGLFKHYSPDLSSSQMALIVFIFLLGSTKIAPINHPTKEERSAWSVGSGIRNQRNNSIDIFL